MKDILFTLLVVAVLLGFPAIHAEYDNWRCSQGRLACALNTPDVFFGTKTYPSILEIIREEIP